MPGWVGPWLVYGLFALYCVSLLILYYVRNILDILERK